MDLKAKFSKYDLHFIRPGGTSRGVLSVKETYFIKLESADRTGIGECAFFRGLSIDNEAQYELKLLWLCKNINLNIAYLKSSLKEYPSIVFGLEQAFLSLGSDGMFELIPSKFTKGEDAISINGLVWMGDKSFMKKQIEEKLKLGFRTIKLKIGAIDFDAELELLGSIRKEYDAKEIEIRVDANGAFQTEEALEKLKILSDFNLHSIEQPIQVKQWDAMADLCEKSPLPIALDEELIGVFNLAEREKLIQYIRPQYLIFKPSLIGGFEETNAWIELSKKHDVGWWITSALESNIGLNAIAQYTYTLQTNIPQGLGTGGLFNNNIRSPLKVENGNLNYYLGNEDSQWGNYRTLFK